MSENAPDAPAEGRKDRRLFVSLMILTTVLIFIAAEGLLFYRWATITEPSSILEVIGSDDLRGAEVSVSGLGLLQPHRAVIGQGERLALPFYLDPGSYTVSVEMNGQTIYQVELALMRERLQRIDLSKLPRPPAAAPATAPEPRPSP
jgi:hypothetical protein